MRVCVSFAFLCFRLFSYLLKSRKFQFVVQQQVKADACVCISRVP